MPLKCKYRMKIMELPKYRPKKDVVLCSMCHKYYDKLYLYQTKEINARYVCNLCKKRYRGKLDFIEKNLDIII